FLKPISGSATKSFVYNVEKMEWQLEAGYKAGKLFDGYSFPVENITEAFEVIDKHSDYPFFMIQGDFLPGISLKNIYRRKREDRGDDIEPTLTDRSLNLVCFDVDGYECSEFGTNAIELFIQELPAPFGEADYIYQYSASYGLFDDGKLKCHLFFWLESAVLSTDIRAWIIEYNKEKNWKNVLDPAVFVATQPVYTQRRKCSGAPDPITDFLGLVTKSGNLDWRPRVEVVAASQKRTSRKTS
ncbi:unnamed protein product, partial [marine sediment metagenome]